MNRARILVVDDEPQIHRFLRPALELAGYDVDRADTAAEGLRQVGLRSPAAILLDLGLPDMDGQMALLELRKRVHMPIIVVSARDRSEQKVQALGAGADDYVEKPFDVEELVARLRACLRRALVQDGITEPWRAGPLVVDLLNRIVTVDDQEVALTSREYDLLTALARRPGRVITHRQLLHTVWGPGSGEQVQYLRVYVGHLRQKLGPIASAMIRTEPGVGYRLKPID